MWTQKQDLAALLKADFETVPASLTRHALGYMRVVRPDVVISNYQLPDGDASQLLQSMASSAEFSGIPVAVVLDETESSHEAMMRQLGAAAIIFEATIQRSSYGLRMTWQNCTGIREKKKPWALRASSPDSVSWN